MRYLKKPIAIIVLITLLLPMIPLETFASEYFPDMVGHWAAPYVDDLYIENVTQGYPDGNFYPDLSITIGEFATLLDRYYYDGFDRDRPGVSGADYHIYHVEFLEDIGILERYGSQTDNISRVIGVRTIINAIESPDFTGLDYEPEFTDSYKINPQDYVYVNYAEKNGVLNGYPDGTFRPDRELSRAEAAKLLFTVQNDYTIKPGNSPPDPDDVVAVLDISSSSTLEWNYKEFYSDTSISESIRLDAGNSTSAYPLVKFDFELIVGETDYLEVGSSSTFRQRVDIKPSNFNLAGVIPITGDLIVENSEGYSDQTNVNSQIEISVVNDKPIADFTHSTNNYATLPVTITDYSSDPEDDLVYMEWEIRNSRGDLILYSDIDLTDNSLNFDYTESYFTSADMDSNGGTLIFTQEDYYTVKQTVYDKGDSSLGLPSKSDTYSKTVYVNSEPQPPQANFDMYEFGFPNESLTITDTSTDPNNDITQRTWTEPEFKIEDGTPANYTGTLSESGGNLTFSEEGTYEVSLQVKDYTNLQDSITKKVKIIPPIPVAVITEGGTLKENRKVTLDMRDSLSPRVDPVQTERNTWEITPLEGQSEDSIKIDTDTSTDEQLNVLFKEIGKYEVYLKVHNNFSDANPTHTDIGASDTTKVIEITEDLDPVPDFSIDGLSPNFIDNPNSTKVTIQELAYSIDEDIINNTSLVVYRDMDEDGSFEDESIYGTYNTGNSDIDVDFQEGISGLFKVELTATEEFGQETIDKFVSSADRRTNTKSKVFNVNWIPDIQYNLPEWLYTDDTFNIITELKDENVDTLNVEWSLKKADETEITQMNTVNISEKIEGSLDNNGGNIRFKESGYYELTATVTDELGQSYVLKKEIRIYPLPTAVIIDGLQYKDEEFQTKENRRYLLDGKNSYAHDYYGEELHSIDHSKDYWEIIPLDGQNANEVIKIAKPVGQLSNDSSTDDKFIKIDDEFDESLIFREKGQYKIRYKVTNKHGKESPYEEVVVTVLEDKAPVVDFFINHLELDINYDESTDQYMINPDFENYPIGISLYIDKNYYSSDFDLINDTNLNVYRDYNADEVFTNDEIYNSYGNESSDIELIFNENTSGLFNIGLTVIEEFGQETIDRFVYPEDRRTTTVNKIVNVNWIPDIQYNLPEWLYTDDTFKIDTELKDENVDTLNVEWSLKKADETEITQMNTVNISEKIEGSLDNNGGNIRFKESGYYELTATVTDELGQSYVLKKEIRIYPLPTAVIKDGMSYLGIEFQSKENRKYLLDGKDSYAYDYYGEELHPIDHTKDYWEIIPLDGQNANEVIKISNSFGGTLINDSITDDKFASINNIFDEMLLFKQKGQYRVRYKVTNEIGKESLFEEVTVNVLEDSPPEVEFTTPNKVYRNPTDNNYAKVVISNISSNSKDYDIISSDYIVRYRYDSNNNGSFTEHSWSSPITYNETDLNYSFRTNKLGKYEIEVVSIEEFGQETIDYLVEDSDKKRNSSRKVIEIDNLAPDILNFEIRPIN